MGTFILKRKTFDDSEDLGPAFQPRKNESHFLRNTALTAGAVGIGVMAGRHGLLGKHMQKWTNAGITRAGSALKGSSSKTISDFGKKMEASGSARYTNAVKDLEKRAADKASGAVTEATTSATNAASTTAAT